MAVRFLLKTRTYDQLKALSAPATSTQPEAIPFTFWDQQNIASNAATTSYFATVQTDPTLGNIQQQNTLSADQYFQLEAATFDWIIGATSQASSGAPQIVDDLLALLNTGRAFVNMQMAMKQYVQTPLHCFHSSGGISVQYQLGTPTGSALGNYAQNWYPDGGYNIGGSIMLPPRQTFTWNLQTNGSFTLNATRATRFTLWGTLYRKVG